MESIVLFSNISIQYTQTENRVKFWILDETH